MSDILVIANRYPDLDGCTCAYAYVELLSKQGFSAVAGYQDPSVEAQWLFDKLGLALPNNGEKLANMDYDVILVDMSQDNKVNMVKPSNVIEIVDHRKYKDTDKFPNAKIVVDLVGSATTLIVEKFRNSNIIPEEKTALLLYYTTLSHTICLSTNVTTQRDKAAVKWLLKYCKPDDNILHNMFSAKSNLIEDLENNIINEFAIDEQLSLAILQFEIVDAKSFLEQHIDKIKDFVKLKLQQHNLKYFLLTCIDLDELKNYFYVIDGESEKLFSSILGVKFKLGYGESRCVVMRKEIRPKIRDFK